VPDRRHTLAGRTVCRLAGVHRSSPGRRGDRDVVRGARGRAPALRPARAGRAGARRTGPGAGAAVARPLRARAVTARPRPAARRRRRKPARAARASCVPLRCEAGRSRKAPRTDSPEFADPGGVAARRRRRWGELASILRAAVDLDLPEDAAAVAEGAVGRGWRLAQAAQAAWVAGQAERARARQSRPADKFGVREPGCRHRPGAGARRHPATRAPGASCGTDRAQPVRPCLSSSCCSRSARSRRQACHFSPLDSA
jgi:hypothetical protein